MPENVSLRYIVSSSSIHDLIQIGYKTMLHKYKFDIGFKYPSASGEGATIFVVIHIQY